MWRFIIVHKCLISELTREGRQQQYVWFEPSASQQEEDLSVWELPADGQHLEADACLRLRSLRRLVMNSLCMKDAFLCESMKHLITFSQLF